MTKVLITVHRDSVCFECDNHSGDHDVCTIVSTLCNVLVAQVDPQVYNEGYVRIVDDNASDRTRAVFIAVEKVFRDLAETHPDYIKVY